MTSQIGTFIHSYVKHSSIETMDNSKVQEARQTIDVLHEISTILNTGLDREALSLSVSLLESGVNPEALAAVVKELRRESAALRLSESTSGNPPASTQPQ